MEFRKFGNKYVVRMDRPEGVVSTLKQFARLKDYLRLDHGDWAVNKVKVGFV